MGFFKKPVLPIDNDEEIRREIRARVAKQAGIFDEEYINTGKISGAKKVETPEDTAATPPVVVAPIPVITENEKGETELSFEPVKREPKPAKQLKEPKAPKESKPAKQPKEPKAPKESKPAKKKKKNIALILFIVVLILAFIPLYYFLTGGDIQGPQLKITNPDNTVLLTQPLMVRGMVSDSDNTIGVKVYYSVDNGGASLLYTFGAGPGPFEARIEFPDTGDFLGEHALSLYAENPKGELSKATVLNFEVVKPELTGLKLISPPTKTKYVEGEPLDLTGLVVSASYEDEQTTQISEYTSDNPTGTRLMKPGEILITISYSEENITKTATFKISVEMAAVEMPSKKANGIFSVPAQGE